MRRPVVVGWAVLVAGGWAATQWLGEPSATAGPGPAPAPSAGVSAGNPEPGPQPESGRCETPRPEPAPSASDGSWPDKEAYDSGRPQTTLVVCHHVVLRDSATAR
ncbi:hypothetical protein ACFYSH_03070 [Streptomyces sp. NPDC005791]|uniref:hypothetical protein n=1 Tax=Streptomyces sp. NPDC005791 TaxID=3364732 RepID=UPI00367BABF4